MRIPPPPGGGMPPPPPMGMVKEEDIFVKLGMKRKKKWNLENPTKRTNWKSVRIISTFCKRFYFETL
jgi:hypothetical protein